MKKVIFNFAIFSLIAVAFASCQKEEKALKTEFGAQYDNESADAKTVYNDGVFSWSDNDKVKIYDNEEHSGVYTVYPGSVNPFYASIRADETTVTEESAPYIGIFPASVAINKNTVELPTIQHSPDGTLTDVPMYAVTDNDQMRFKNLCGVLRIRLHQDDVHVKRIVLTTDKIINGKFNVTVGEDNIPSIAPVANLVDGYTVSGSYTTALVCDEVQSIGGEGHIFYLYLPAGHYEDMTLTLYDEHDLIASKTAHDINITRSKYTKVAIEGNMTFAAPEGALKGLFSIRPDRRVRFSKGNLHYGRISGTYKWSFAEHQWDYAGQYGSYYDLFPWAASGYNGTNPTNRVNNSSNSGYYSAVRNIVGTQYDWGLHNPIENGGNAKGLWFTMSSSEWGYLLHCRPNALSKQGIGTVNDVKGLIILPDIFEYPAGCPVLPTTTFLPSNANNVLDNSEWGYGRVVYNAAQWAQMEENGAAFLPAAGYYGSYNINSQSKWGYRQTHLDNDKPIGYYWTSTRWLRLADVNYSRAGYESVISLFFMQGRTNIGQYVHCPSDPGAAGSVNPDQLIPYYWSASVRLVQDENMVNVMPEYYLELDGHPHYTE